MERADCADDRAVDEFFRRAGVLLRLLQALGATDLHHENFVPTDQLPILIDLETVIGPGPLRTNNVPEDRVTARLADTPGSTSMVTSAVAGDPGLTCVDLGALAGPSTRLTPYRVPTLVQGPRGPELHRQRLPLRNGAALPTRTGEPVALSGHEAALLDGYTEAQRRLTLIDPDLLLADDAAEPRVRFVARPTRTYARLLQRSLAPEALTDGAERELVLEELYRASGTADCRLIACEVEALRDLDIPLFTVPFAGEDLISDRGTVVPDQLSASPLVRTRTRLRSVSARTDHVDDLKATLFCADPEAVDPGSPPHPVTGEPIALLLERAITRADGFPAWIGLEHDPNRQRWDYGPLGSGLSGQAGIGLSLALVAAHAPAPPPGCRELARAALLGSAARTGSGEAGPADLFGGPAGTLFACAAAGRLLDDLGLVDAAVGLIGASLAAARRAEPSTVIDGTAGAVLALRHLDGPEAAAAAEESARLLDVTDRIGIVDPPDRWTGSLPSRALGRRLTGRSSVPPAGPTPPPGSADVAYADVWDLVGADHRDAADHGSFDAERGDRRAVLARAAAARRARDGRWFAPTLAPDTALVCGVHGLAAVAALITPGVTTSMIDMLTAPPSSSRFASEERA